MSGGAPRERPIRVWLEPGYDYGRFGAWMLDWPGCFAWGASREIALARVPSAANGHAAWLAGHGEVAPPVESDVVEIVEEVPATLVGDYELNATFAADRRPVTDDELAASVRRLTHARSDLLALAQRLGDFEARGGSLPVESRDHDGDEAGASAGRPADEVLRHVAGAETWLVSRLERDARFDAVARSDEPRRYLDATRGWAVDRLQGMFARDPAMFGTDGKGETWTLAKLLRRFLYHSLDHLEELDRRLAKAERRVDRLDVRLDAPVPVDELIALLEVSAMRRRAAYGRERLQRMLDGSAARVSAWDGDRLVGFGRLISDGATNGYISTVAVHPHWQDRGLGRRLMERLMQGRDHLSLALGARPGVEGFYERFGFQRDPTAMNRRRRR